METKFGTEHSKLMARGVSSIIEIKEDEFAIIGESNSTFGGNKSMDSNQSLSILDA